MNLLLLLLLSWSGVVMAANTPALANHDRWKCQPCVAVAQMFKFGITATRYQPEQYYQQQCSNLPYLQTVLKCMQDHTDEKRGLKQFHKLIEVRCEENGFQLNAKDLLPIPQLITVEDMNKTQTGPVEIPQEMYEPSYKSYSVYFHQTDLGTYLGIGILSYWVLILLVGSVVNLTRTHFFPVLTKMTGLHINTLRKHITLPAAFGYKHSQPFRTLQGVCSMCMPTRVQSVIVTVYVLFAFIACFPGYVIFDENTVFESNPTQLRRYLANRTGILAFAQLPLLFLFAGRNNIMMWFTGWSFDTFNVYHRWIARTMMAYSIAHGVTYTILTGKYLSSSYPELYFFMGVIAVIAGSFMCIQGLHFFRSRYYEAFLVIHIILAILFTIGVWYHAEDVGFQEWIYASIAVWAFDRLARLIRIFMSGIICKGKFNIVDHENKIIRVEISYSKLWKVYPGAHVFVYVLTPQKFWESHPFTIYQSPKALENGNFSIMLKAKDGMTRRVFEKLQSNDDIGEFNLLVEGPYGHQLPVRNYDSAVVIAGGIGVTATYSYAADLLKCPSTKSIIFAWIVRNDAAIDWFKDELNNLLQDPRVNVSVFVSLESTSSSDDEKFGPLTTIAALGSSSDGEKSADDSSSSTPSKFAITYGSRPNMGSALPEFLSSCEGSTAIVVCGPPMFNDDIRQSVSDSLHIRNERVDYYEESFSW